MAAHFTPELFTFMRQLKRNNDRVWFEKNRDRYLDVVRDPMLQFISEFGPKLRTVSRHFVADPRPQGGSMFRIYRDTRFSKDKRPYKTAAAAQFRHERGKDVHAPGFYLHLGVDGVFFGGGLWHPDRDTLAMVRHAIVDQPARWRRVVSSKAFREGYELGGDSLKRPPRGFDPESPLIEDIKRKDFYWHASMDESAACAPDFLDRYARACRAGAPLVRFLADATDLEF